VSGVYGRDRQGLSALPEPLVTNSPRRTVRREPLYLIVYSLIHQILVAT